MSLKDYPVSYNRKLEELLERGLTQTAAREILSQPIEMELIYEKEAGLFLVESEAIPCNTLVSPYTKKRIKENTQ